MPGFDRTGPSGMGPMTGGRRGVCGSGYADASSRFGRGYGYGRGYGQGRGFRNRCFAQGMGFGRGYGRGYGGYPPAYTEPYPANTTEELQMLKGEADNMKQALDSINQRIAELEKNVSES